MKVISSLRPWRDEMNTLFPQRETVIDAALICLIAKQNMMLIGDSGAGKTRFVEQVLQSLYCDNVFRLQLDKGTRREEIIGMYDPKLLREEGVFKVETEGFLPTARFAGLDEFLSVTPGVARTILGIIHPYEHVFRSGQELIPCPLESCFATSNTLPVDQDLDAVYQRFAVILHVNNDDIGARDEYRIYNSYRADMENFLTEKVRKPVQSAAKKVSVPAEVLKSLREYRRKISDSLRPISIRSACYTLDLARAAAACCGSSSVGKEHLDFVVPLGFSRFKDDSVKISLELAL